MTPQEEVWVDLKRAGLKRRVKGSLAVSIVRHGIWEIDKVPGKALCLIELDLPSEGINLNLPTTHAYCEKYVDAMLQCESLNDRFEFPNPQVDRHRPQELLPKIARLQKVLDKWKGSVQGALAL